MKGKISNPPMPSQCWFIFLPSICSHALWKRDKLLLLDPWLQEKKPMTQQSSSIIRKGHPYSHQKYKTCAPLAARLSVLQNGPWWGDTQDAPPLLPLHVRTDQNGLGNGLFCTQALGVFNQPELDLLAPLGILPVRVFSVYEFLWWKFLLKTMILSEIGKKNLWKVFLKPLLVGRHHGKLIPQTRKGNWPS